MKQKNIKINFFLSGQSNKQKAISNNLAFSKIWTEKFSKDLNLILLYDRKIGVDTVKKIKFKIFSYSQNNKTYFGYVGIEREALLPSVFNSTTQTESDFVLNNDDEVVEKSYFIYHSDTDILSFHQNHLGPRVEDLNFVLEEINDHSEDFEPIWRKDALQKLLNGESVIKTAEITIAIPRNFNYASINLTNPWCNNIIDMMDKNGMSRLRLNFSGRAASKKSALGYLSSSIVNGIAEFVSVFGNISPSKSSPKLEKAEVLPVGGTKNSLLDKEISSTQVVTVIKGYPTLTDIENSIRRAFDSQSDDLKPYFKNSRS